MGAGGIEDIDAQHMAWSYMHLSMLKREIQIVLTDGTSNALLHESQHMHCARLCTMLF